MSLLHALLYGIVEGIGEFLPISSTGHLILLSTILRESQTDFVKTFEIVIQLGAILAAVVLYAKRLLTNWRLLGKVIVAFIPTGIIGLAVYHLVKTYLLGNQNIVLIALLLGGIALIVFEYWYARRIVQGSTADLSQLTYGQAFFVGLIQVVSFIPGVSRSAATIVGGMLMGVNRAVIVEFSFMLAIPTMAAATGLDLLKTGWQFSHAEWMALAVGLFASFIVALFAIRWLIRFVKSNTFTPFGVYRIAASILFWLLVVRG
jgi:undecaprenyl-diphosphatase